MLSFNVEQGSPEWLAARAGKITASNFIEIRKKMKTGPRKGDFSAAADDYAFRIAIERISGKLLDEEKFNSWAMKRGTRMEEEARIIHEERIGTFIEQTGFVCSDDERFGASADGLIGDDDGAEYKCLVDPARIKKVYISEDISEFMDQVQGCMWITGRPKWQFCLYCPALESIGKEFKIIHVKRDQGYIDELVEDLERFDDLVTEYRFKMDDRSEEVTAEGMFG